jgi:hypothetical protein
MIANRDWMYRWIVDNELSHEYMDIVESFIEFAMTSVITVDPIGWIRCPCKICKNNRFVEPHVVRHHLYKKGFCE